MIGDGGKDDKPPNHHQKPRATASDKGSDEDSQPEGQSDNVVVKKSRPLLQTTLTGGKNTTPVRKTPSQQLTNVRKTYKT